LTSVGQRDEVKQGREAGIAAALTKPIRQSQLFNTLASVVGNAPQPAPRQPLLVVPQQTGREGNTQKRPRILVAEDNPVNQMLVARLLDKLGYRADVAGNGLEVLEAVSSLPYAAVLMDCQMPEMDGYEATQAIRQRETTAATVSNSPSPTPVRLPIIAMTANALQGDREKCLEVGMDDYIARPIRAEVLRSTLARWVSQDMESPEQPMTQGVRVR